MKTFIFLFAFALSLVSFTSQSGDTRKNPPPAKTPIDITLVSSTGCRVHVVGVLDVNLLPPSFNSFTGTVTLSGPGCPDVTLTFGLVSGSDLTLTPDTQNPCTVSKFVWKGSTLRQEVVKELNAKYVNTALVNEVRQICVTK